MSRQVLTTEQVDALHELEYAAAAVIRWTGSRHGDFETGEYVEKFTPAVEELETKLAAAKAALEIE